MSIMSIIGWTIFTIIVIALVIGIIVSLINERKAKQPDKGVANEIKKLTPPPNSEFEGMTEALALSTIFPTEFVQAEMILERTTGKRKGRKKRREDLEKFWLENLDHPLHPSKVQYFITTMNNWLENPSIWRADAMVQTVNSELIKTLAQAHIMPHQCDYEVRYAEGLSDEYLSVKEDFGNTDDFFKRFRSHPLGPRNFRRFLSALYAVNQKKPHPEAADLEKLRDILEKSWKVGDYYFSGNIVYLGWLESRKRLKNSAK